MERWAELFNHLRKHMAHAMAKRVAARWFHILARSAEAFRLFGLLGEQTMAEQPAGPLLDALGVTIDLEPHQQLTDVLVIGKVADFDNDHTPLVLAKSSGLDWIAQLGLIHAARLVSESGPIENVD